MDMFWLALGLAVFGYYIGEGLKNFKKGSTSHNFLDLEDESDHKLLRQSELHWFIGVSKEDAKKLIEEHPNIPHIMLNGKVYYPRENLKKWLLNIGHTEEK